MAGARGSRGEPDPRWVGRQDNGLTAAAFVPLTDVEPAVGPRLLDALGRARIAAYLSATADEAAPTRRLFVASDDRVDARTIVAAAIRGMRTGDAPGLPVADDTRGLPAADETSGLPAADETSGLPAADDDPRDPESTRRAFDELVSDWHVDTVAAVRDAERDLTREDADWRARLAKPQSNDETWLDEDHFVPPAPPPLPRLAVPTIVAMTVLAISVVLLGIGGQFGLASTFTLLLGVCGMVLGFAILFSRLREHHRDEDDDGSAI